MEILFIGRHVSWKKLEGRPDASMQELYGFGVLSRLDANYRMVINGDYGVTTSIVKAIDSQENGSILVTTLNSVYLVIPR
jgi:hypothetical protein